MRHTVIVLAGFALLAAALGLPAAADDEAIVGATVSAFTISISVNPASVNYGPREAGSEHQKPTPGFFTAKNTGNVDAVFWIRGADTTDWELKATAGADQYVHRWAVQGTTTFKVMTLANQLLWNTVLIAPLGEVPVELEMDLPTSSSVSTTQTANVTVVAMAP